MGVCGAEEPSTGRGQARSKRGTEGGRRDGSFLATFGDNTQKPSISARAGAMDLINSRYSDPPVLRGFSSFATKRSARGSLGFAVLHEKVLRTFVEFLVSHLTVLDTSGRDEIHLLPLTDLWIAVIRSLQRKIFHPLSPLLGSETRGQYCSVPPNHL